MRHFVILRLAKIEWIPCHMLCLPMFLFAGNDAERRVGMISSLDPIPFSMTQCLKTIFTKISVKVNIPYDRFYREMTHRECNDELVKVGLVSSCNIWMYVVFMFIF